VKKYFAVVIVLLGMAGVVQAGPESLRSADAYQHYLKAILYDTQGNLPLAQEELAKAIRLSPDNAFLYKTVAEIAFRQGNLPQAQDAIKKSIELDPSKTRVYILAGQIYWSLGDTAGAEDLFKKAVDLSPDEAEPLMNLAMAVTPKDPKRAIKLYQNYLTRHPGEYDIRERVAQLQQSVGDIDEAEKSWEKVLEWDPSSLRAHLSLAQLSEVRYDTSTAISHYEAVIKQDPTNLSLLLRLGELQYRSNDMSKAYDAFSKAQAIAPNSVSASFWLALLSEHRGEWDNAILYLKQVAEKATDPGVYLRLSYYYSQAGRYKEATGVLEKLVASEPNNADFLNYLAIAYDQDKSYAKAEKILLRKIALDPTDHEAYFQLATVYDRLKKFPLAEEALLKAIDIKPDYAMALNYLGYTYADRNVNLKEAEKLVSHALALDPQNPAYLDSMGWVYYRYGKYVSAEEYLRQATSLARDPLIWSHLGDVQTSQQKTIDAILSWDESLRIDPAQKDLRARVRKTVRGLPLRHQIGLFVRRGAVNASEIKSIKCLVEISVCEKHPCIKNKAQFQYEKGGVLRIEIPGPLGGPLMLLTKKPNKPSEYGAIHPVFQSIEYFITRASDRIESIWSGNAFRALDIAALGESAAKKSGGLTGKTDSAEVLFEAVDGNALKFKWNENGHPDSLVLSGYDAARAVAMPLTFEWKDESSGFVLQMTLVDPVVGTTSSASHEK
jgi:tetratricopeptide (TPR) repeat protein